MPVSSVFAARRRSAYREPFNDSTVEKQYPPNLELEPIHLDIALRVDIANTRASGAVVTTVQARRNGPNLLLLDAVDLEDLRVDDADGQPLQWRYDGGKLIVQWDKPFATGEQRRLRIAYTVIKPVAGLYFSQPNPAYPAQAWYAATDHETERARHWLPCIDLPNVRTTLDFHLQAESRFTIVANGALLEETENGDGTKTAHWRLDQRCPSYLICFAIGDFTVAEDGVFINDDHPIPVAYYGSRQRSAADLLRTFGRTKAMLAWMTKKLDMAFPYPKYYQFALPGLNGAMENISLVSWDERYVQDETLALEYQWLIDQVNVHEMAHSYFGDAIVCRDFAHGWLKESWATYIEYCWRAENYSPEEAAYVYYDHASAYFEEADNRYQRPIVTRRFKSSWQMYDAHLYEGGACRLHTLRQELGDEVFWAAVQDYLQRYNGKVVETDDFRHVLEEHSGRALGQFFDQWFYTPAYPDIKVTFTYEEKSQHGLFTIEQLQVNPAKDIPAFVLNTELGWTMNGESHLLPLRLDQPKQTITVAMASAPEQVRFDPNYKALHKLTFNPGDTLLRRQLVAAPDVIGRIQAATELMKTGKRANTQAVVDAYKQEPFWGVRHEMVRALGKANSEAAIEGLVQIVSLEQEPLVLSSLLRAAGAYRDVRLRDAVAARLAQSLPYIATQVAYEALGAQRQNAPWQTLVNGAEQSSFNGYAQSGAFRGLAATRRTEAIDLLLARLPYGATDNDARPAAIAALADIGQGQEKANRERITEALIDLLRDPWDRVRRAAAQALRTMKASSALAALDAYSRTLSAQERVAIERIITDLRDEDKVDGSAAKKQIEDLTEQVRKLEDRLQTLEAQSEPAEK